MSPMDIFLIGLAVFVVGAALGFALGLHVGLSDKDQEAKS